MAKSQDTKEKLLETALNLIWAQSYEGVSVDEICEAAGARKGSFYHYFSSKAELALAALEASWEALRPEMDRVFSPQARPLERLAHYLKVTHETQVQQRKKFGYVVGCPYTSIGCEQCGGEKALREKAHEILERIKKYLVSALRDAQEEGWVKIKNPEKKAAELFALELGAHAEARIANSLEPLETIDDAWLTLLSLDSFTPKKKAA